MRHWIPNNFVPLIPLGEVDAIELSDNFGFETSNIFQELETESVPTVNLQEPEPTANLQEPEPEPTIKYQVCYGTK